MERPGGTFLVITGPTASGKTSFSMQLARRITIEIINCDVGQFYRPLSIGTAKPDLTTVSVPHHLFDVMSTPTSFSAMAYRKKAILCVQDILARKALPVFVGGSLFYIKSLFFPPQEQDVEIGHCEELYLNHTGAPIESSILWEDLHRIDPTRALAINRNDRYRIIRALDLWRQTGRLPSSYAPVFSPIGPNACIVTVTHDRHLLNARINTRVKEMVDQGLFQEIAALSPEWRNFVKTKKLIGYYEILSENQDKTPHSILEKIQQNTRAYAKRQMTFLRTLLTTIKAIETVTSIEANLTLCDDYLYIEQIVAWAKEDKRFLIK